MNKNKNESGRSMVEMLGTLAIMGVLSIGGIAGYNYGINKHRANQVLQDIRLVYQELKYPNTVRQIVADGTFPDMELEIQSPYEYSFDFPNLEDFNYDSKIEKTPNLISVNVSGVSKTACDILLKSKPEYVLILKANGQSTWNCTADENELSYIFEITTDSLEYGTCSVCTGEHCFDDDLNCPEGEYCYNDTCSKCAPAYTLQTNDDGSQTCVQCSATTFNAKISLEDCYRCKGTKWGYVLHSGGPNGCMNCERGLVQTTKELCEERCGHIDGMMYMSGYCGSCKNFNYFSGATREECEKCIEYNPDIIFYPTDAEGTGSKGLCTKCGNMGSGANSRKNEDGTACECPDGNFWVMGGHSFCRSCSIEYAWYSSKIECDKCPNRYYDVDKGGNDRNGPCPRCLEGQIKDTSTEGDGRRCVNAPVN